MTIKSLGRCCIIQLFAIAALPSTSFAQGEDNPTGVTGIYNGNVTTAGSYDPMTGNAMRGGIDDIVVPGSVGAYPLKWTRYFNSRNDGGSWTFSYNYRIYPSTLGLNNKIAFPDGRVIDFANSCLSGVEESRDSWNGKDAIFLADGGKVLFDHYVDYIYVANPDGTTSTILSNYYLPIQVIDPYGQVTTISYDNMGNDHWGNVVWRRSRITEPGGRYLQINYTNSDPTNQNIASVQAFDGQGNLLQSVSYTSTDWTPPGTTSVFKVLTAATYSDGTSANYTYTLVSRGADLGRRPALATADDPRYSGGPMRQIAYTYIGQGVVASEKNFVTGEAVSSLTNSTAGPMETRGDGATRTFAYRKGGKDMDGICSINDPAGGKLVSYTDFLGHTTTLHYTDSGFIDQVTDPNNRTTTYTRGDPTYPVPYQQPWAIYKITYPDGSMINQTFSDEAHPYFLATRTAPHGPSDPIRTTTYTRDANNRITRKDYPDGSFETFTYNSLGEVLQHEMTSGGTESFTYDSRGLKTSYMDAIGGTTTYVYYGANDPVAGNAWIDRLKTVTHPANASGFQATETFEYDRAFDANGLATGAPITSRGLVTKTTHADNTSVTNVYDIYGQLRSTTDELGHTTTHTYDDYGRVLTTTDPLNHTTANSYIPTGKTSSYITTSKLPFVTTLPSGKSTNSYYDANWRKTRVQVAPGTSDESNSYSNYDEGAGNVGHLTSTIDPRNNKTMYGYDIRDRLISVTDPLNHTSTVVFDAHGNKTSETHANNEVITYDSYDPMNRLLQKTVHRDASTMDVTHMTYDSAGNLATNTDENGHVYRYTYDAMNRPTRMTYPNNLFEAHVYDAAGNVNTYTNRSGAVQTFAYDNRNRQTSFSWNDNSTSSQSAVYDAASRKTQILNNDATINFTYDDANRLLTQEEWETTANVGDNVHRTVTYSYDADGNRSTIQYPSGAKFDYGYTQRNQVANITLDGQQNPIVSYAFDLSGNITGRTLDNGTSTAYTVDAVNRDTAVVHNLLPTGTTKRFDYAYNSVNDITAVQRDSANGDGFAYDLTQQIIGFQRDGASVNLSAGTVTGGTANAMEFDGTGNRTKLNGTSSSYNNMNQPTDAGITYDTNGNLKTWNGWTYLYDAQNRLRSAVNTGASPQLGASTNIMVQFYYDGLNRQVARSMTNVVLPPPPYPPPLIREAPTRASGPTFDAVFSVWDGDWAILEEYTTGNVLIESYVQGYHGLVKTVQTNIYYYQDELGSTSHIANSSGALLEYYKYDLYGKPTYFSSTSQPLNSSTYGVKDLFTGQRWIPELGLYDDRNRFMSPDLGRFLQPDPIGFKGDSSNLYRYCGNDWANKTDPMGLFGDQQADRANMQREQHDQHMDASQQVAAMELRNCAYAPTAGKVERQTQQQLAREAKQAGEGFSTGLVDKAASADPKHYGSWQDAGKAGAAEAIPLAQADPQHREYKGDFGQSDKNPRDFTYGPPQRGGYGPVNDGIHKPGNYNTSVVGKPNLPSGYHRVGIYWAFPFHTSTWHPGDRQALWTAHLNGVLGIPPSRGAVGASDRPRFPTYEYVPGSPSPE